MASSTIGFRMAELRKKIGYSQVEMAKELRISRSLVGQIERDLSKPNLELLSHFVRITNTSYAYVIDGIGSSNEFPVIRLEYIEKLMCDNLYPLAEIHADLNNILQLIKDQKDHKPYEWMNQFEITFKALVEFRKKYVGNNIADQNEIIQLLLQTRDDLTKYEELLREKVRNIYLELKLKKQ
jgi:transcriptional regulator with XRE-family HTH domain